MAETNTYVFNLVDEMSSKLNKIDKNVDRFNRNIEDTDRNTSNASRSMQGWGSTLLKGAVLIGGVTLALVALKKGLDFTIRSVFSFSGASAKLRAIVQPTTEEFKKLEAAALKLGSTTAFTASQVLDAYTEQAKLGQEVNEILASGSAILDLAASSQIDLAVAATTATQTLNQFNLSADKTNMVVDVMAKSFTSSALDANKFGESMKFVGTIGAETGNSIYDVTGVLGILADRSIEASQAGTATRRVMLELADSNSAASKAITATGEKATTFVEKLKVLNKMNLDVSETTRLFGMLSSTAATVMIKNADAVDELSESLSNADGSAKEMANTMLDSLPGAVTVMGSALEGLALTTKDVLTPALTALINEVTDLAVAWKFLLSGKAREEQQKRNDGVIKEVKELQNLRLEYEQVRDTQLALQAQGGSLFSEGLLKESLDNIETINKAIQDVNKEFLGISEKETPEKKKIDTGFKKAQTEFEKKEALKLSEFINDLENEKLLINASNKNKELIELQIWYNEQLKLAKNNKEAIGIINELADAKDKEIRANAQKEREEKEAIIADETRQKWLDTLEFRREQRNKEAKEAIALQQQINDSLISGAQRINNTLFNISKQKDKREKKREIDRIKASTLSEEEKAKKIEAIEKVSFERNKKKSMSEAFINGALGITKTIATTGFPAAIPLLIAQGIVMATQMAQIASQKFGDGGIVKKEPGIPVTGDKHIIAVNPGERILTEEQQKNIGTSTTVSLGDTNIIINGNVNNEQIEEITTTIEEQNEQVLQSIKNLVEQARINDGVVI